MRTSTAPGLWICVVVALIAGTGAAAPVAPAAPDAGCSIAHPNRLYLTASDLDERRYLDSTVVCADADSTEATLRNDTGVVWSFASGGGDGYVEPLSAKLGAQVFREGLRLQDGNPPQFVAPGEVMLLTSSTPGGIRDITWTIDPELTALWLVQDAITSRLQKLMKGGIASLLASRKAVRGAVFTCASAGVEAGSAAVDLVEDSADFLDVFGVAASLEPCAKAWRAARAEVPVRFPTARAAVTGALDTAAQVTKLRSSMSLASKIASVALKLAPR